MRTDITTEILDLIKLKEAGIQQELGELRAWRKAVMNGTAIKAGRGKAPRVSLTADDDDVVPGRGLPAPKRTMSAAARAKLSKMMKARWRARRAGKA